MGDFDARYGPIRDEDRLEEDGRVTSLKVVRFWLGKHGPFTERFTPDEWAAGLELPRRVEQIRQQLNALPK